MLEKKVHMGASGRRLEEFCGGKKWLASAATQSAAVVISVYTFLHHGGELYDASQAARSQGLWGSVSLHTLICT